MEQARSGEQQFYMTNHFDVMEYSLSHLDGDILGRIRNNLIKAINKETLFPKAIIMVPDNDISRNTDFDNFGVSKIFGENLNYLLNDIHHIILSHKDVLPLKAKKYRYPTVIWMVPPGHGVFSDNGKRQKFTKCLDTVAQLHNEMKVMKLKDWSFNDVNLVVQANNMGGYRFTSKGLTTYWRCADSALHFWESGMDHKKPQKFFCKPQFPRRDCYSWKKF